MGQDIRVPGYNNIHNMMANRFQYDWMSFSLGLTPCTAPTPRASRLHTGAMAYSGTVPRHLADAEKNAEATAQIVEAATFPME